MRYNTNIDKNYLDYIVDTFENNLYEMVDDNFDKRSSITRQGGRPYLYSPKEISEKMVIYFRDCVKREQPFMITGLCLCLGISRRGLLRLEKCYKEEFVHVIKKGKDMVEFYLEMQCNIMPNPRFPIFVLKNLGWKDKIETETKTASGALTYEEKEEMRKRIQNFSENN